ncbi:MAG: serine hydrolase domain-containing protein [Gaiellales bacterium]|jgi:CubicO group peptidase (beta-lactamase class C family)
MSPPLEERLRRRLAEVQADDRLPSVSAALGHRGDAVWTGSAGLADPEAGREPTADDQYRIGSITKLFTAIAIMQLREEGALQLDDPLQRHLDEAPSKAPTIRRMLSHTSGMQREVPGDAWITLQVPDRDQLMASLDESEQVLDPGTAFHYSNLAFSLLGEVVARLRDQAWRDVIRERITGPLGMERTSPEPSNPRATGYLVMPYSDEARAEPELDLGGAEPAGQLWSTPSDLLRLGGFLASGEGDVLRPETVDEMHAVQVMTNPEWTLGWGLGPILFRRGERILAGHDGAMPGYLASLLYDRKTRTVASVLTSSGAGHDPYEIAAGLLDEAAADLAAVPDIWRPGEAPPAELEGVLGEWWSEGEQFVFSWRGGSLQARMAGSPAGRAPAIFEPDGDDRFRVKSGRERGELLLVIRDEDGVPTQLRWAGYAATRDPRAFADLAGEP